MPRLTKQDIDAMSLSEVQSLLLRPGDTEASPFELYQRKLEILNQIESGEDPWIITEQRKRANAVRKSHSIEIKAPEQPLTYGGAGARIPAFSAAEQSAQEAYNRRVQQKKQRAEEIWLDGIRETILNLG